MSFRFTFSRKNKNSRTQTSARHRRQPGLEALEDRTAPAVFTVNALTDTNPTGGGAGSGNAGDLRYVLTQSNTAGGTNTIDFQQGLSGTILLQAILPPIRSN